MAKAYFENLTKLFADVPGDFEIKHFFSGAAVYVSGNICISLSPIGFAVKLPEKLCEELLQQGAKPLRYFLKGHVKKGYVVLSKNMVTDRKLLKQLIRKSFVHVA